MKNKLKDNVKNNVQYDLEGISKVIYFDSQKVKNVNLTINDFKDIVIDSIPRKSF